MFTQVHNHTNGMNKQKFYKQPVVVSSFSVNNFTNNSSFLIQVLPYWSFVEQTSVKQESNLK